MPFHVGNSLLKIDPSLEVAADVVIFNNNQKRQKYCHIGLPMFFFYTTLLANLFKKFAFVQWSGVSWLP